MATFAFITMPSPSYIYPSLPVVQELVDQGETVCYYATEPFRQLIEATGATFYSYESRIDEISEAARKAGKPAGLPVHTLEESLFVIPQILERVRAAQPDCIIYEPLCATGRLLARILQIPAVSYRTIIMFTPQLTRIFEENAAKNPAGIQLFSESMQRICALYGVQPFSLSSLFTHEEPLNIVTFPRAFQFEGDSFDERFQFVGPTLAPRQTQSDFPFEELEDQKVLYISQGTIYNDRPDFYKMCFDAFRDTPWRVVLSIGKAIDQKQLGPIPGNFIVRPEVPQLEILKYARVCITHGGPYTLMEAFAAGVPVVVTPRPISDIIVNARRVAELELGAVLWPEALSAETLRQAVVRVSTDPGYTARVLQMKDEIERAGGYKRVVTLLQEYVRADARQSVNRG